MRATVNDGQVSSAPVAPFPSTANNGGNGDTGDELDFPYNHGPGCCGFNNPSWNLVQAYKTDANGLPLLDGSYNSNPLISDPVETPWAGTILLGAVIAFWGF